MWKQIIISSFFLLFASGIVKSVYSIPQVTPEVLPSPSPSQLPVATIKPIASFKPSVSIRPLATQKPVVFATLPPLPSQKPQVTPLPSITPRIFDAPSTVPITSPIPEEIKIDESAVTRKLELNGVSYKVCINDVKSWYGKQLNILGAAGTVDSTYADQITEKYEIELIKCDLTYQPRN